MIRYLSVLARPPAAALGVGLAGAAILSCSPADSDRAGGDGSADGDASFVGGSACAECHAAEARAWSGSHHDLAMQEAGEAAVLGDFEGATFEHGGETFEFSRREDAFLVRAAGPDGQTHEYEIAYTFGIEPLQQYLVRFPGGRFQALGVAWDARPAADGGQRWFHLYPEDEIGPEDVLHWTGPAQTWNYMCAECHSTGLRKGYRLEENAYETSWEEIDVSCEACHGPGSRHVAWARAQAENASGPAAGDPGPMGLLVDLGPGPADWVLEEGAAIARHVGERASGQIEACGRCHSRRTTIVESYEYGRPLADTHRPALLDDDLYHPDGQIEDEVYVYGSFLQSRMYAAGVTCTDCHDAHSLGLRSEGNALCTRCHRATVYDVEAHHFHSPESAGAKCVECHMPARTYMVVDPRRDHSFRLPRPDLSVAIDVPNACSACHVERPADWAARTVAEWYPAPAGDVGPGREAHYGIALAAGREGRPLGVEALAGLAAASDRPAIARATAVSLLGRYLSPEALAAIRRALGDFDPLVRAAAVGALEAIPPDRRAALVAPLLEDPVRGVRIEAGRVLAPAPPGGLTPAQSVALERAIEEYREAQLANADHPSAHVNLALLEASRGRLAVAERELLTALRIGPRFLPAYVNLADVYRVQGREEECEALLRQGLALLPDEAALHHALGLAYARRQRMEEALAELEWAVRLTPDNARFAYVYGIALNSAGRPSEAIEVLGSALGRAPWDRELLVALATIERDRGELDQAVGYARRLVEAWPDDSGARRLLAELESSGG